MPKDCWNRPPSTLWRKTCYNPAASLKIPDETELGIYTNLAKQRNDSFQVPEQKQIRFLSLAFISGQGQQQLTSACPAKCYQIDLSYPREESQADKGTWELIQPPWITCFVRIFPQRRNFLIRTAHRVLKLTRCGLSLPRLRLSSQVCGLCISKDTDFIGIRSPSFSEHVLLMSMEMTCCASPSVIMQSV